MNEFSQTSRMIRMRLLLSSHNSLTTVDVDELDDLIEKLNTENVNKVIFKYFCLFCESVNFYVGPMAIEDITQKLFNWVTEKPQDNHRFNRIHKRNKTNA